MSQFNTISAVEPTMISLPEFTAAGAVPSMVQISDTSAGLTSAGRHIYFVDNSPAK